jgi:hypothetical protein
MGNKELTISSPV